VNIAILEQQADGTLQLATSKYLADPQTNGGNNVLIADFNQDGIADFFLPAHNENPPLPATSSAYLSKADGKYAKVTIGDRVEAHAATLAYVSGAPTVFTGGYYGLPDADSWNGSTFTVIPQTGLGSSSSMAVAKTSNCRRSRPLSRRGIASCFRGSVGQQFPSAGFDPGR
jgi:hypothetical protein